MKNAMFRLTLPALICLFCFNANAIAAGVGDIAFLHGCWQLESNGRKVEEQWNMPAAGSALGSSRTIAGGKTVTWEFMRIHEQDGKLAFTAMPANKPAATFVAIESGPAGVVFENPEHPFPQRVIYRPDGTAKLNARIEGKINGNERGIDFPYLRVQCG